MLRILNTLTGQKEEFIPHNAPNVLMYICGVTPYSDSHVGHGMSYVVFDVMKRYMKYKGYSVKHIQNFTDIDDKIIARAAENESTSVELSQKFIEAYFSDMDLLGIEKAEYYPLATQEIPKIIEMIEGLIEKGFAYQSDGDVYYRVNSFKSYGKLSHRTLDGMMAGARVAISESKENPLDFTLWKKSKPGEPYWESPWGIGRPGWHIECSAMSLEYLGESLDIHGGGADLLFPHHENEIAQSEAFTGSEPFSKYWVHHGLLRLGDEKMSKSIGNLVTIRDAVSQFGKDPFRIFVLTSHYRNPLTWSEEILEGAVKACARLSRIVNTVTMGDKQVLDPATYREQFEIAMDDDFNTPQALAILFDLARDINRSAKKGEDVQKLRDLVTELSQLLGLDLEQKNSQGDQTDSFIELLITLRTQFRDEKNFGMSDFIRDELEKLGVSIEDSNDGTEWDFS